MITRPTICDVRRYRKKRRGMTVLDRKEFKKAVELARKKGVHILMCNLWFATIFNVNQFASIPLILKYSLEVYCTQMTHGTKWGEINEERIDLPIRCESRWREQWNNLRVPIELQGISEIWSFQGRFSSVIIPRFLTQDLNVIGSSLMAKWGKE